MFVFVGVWLLFSDRVEGVDDQAHQLRDIGIECVGGSGWSRHGVRVIELGSVVMKTELSSLPLTMLCGWYCFVGGMAVDRVGLRCGIPFA